MITTEPVLAYLRGTRTPPDELLAEMERHGERDDIPIVVPETGAALRVMTRAVGASRVVEVGTAIGVSTLHIARALPADGVIVSFEIDQTCHRAAQRYLERAGLADRVDLRLMDAAAGLEELERASYDMAFLDGLKGDYPSHLELALEVLRPGGTVLVDNTLLSGTVAGEPGGWSEQHVQTMRQFNAAVLSDPRLDAALLPVGDGLLVAVKIG
jgi:predicted O-methyltransferase YrrM